jgi:hypothetical protein
MPNIAAMIALAFERFSLRGFAMTKPGDLPPIELSKISPEDALRYQVGVYFETFSNLEQLLAMALSNILRIENALVHFMWKDAFTDQKIKTVRRAAIQRLGPENPRWLALKPTLNEIATHAVEFRNQLAHGLIIREAGGTKLGKPGQNPDLLYQGFEKITQEMVHEETRKLQTLALKLVDFLTGKTLAK